MGYFPLYTDIRHFRILMVGGGAIALRRLKTLQLFHEHITVISPSVCKEIEDMALEGFATWISRSYVPGDLKGFDMVLAATITPCPRDNPPSPAGKLCGKSNVKSAR